MDTEENDRYSRNRNMPMRRSHQLAGLPSLEIDEEEYEKPWQKVPSMFLLLLLGAYLTVGYLAQLIEDDMPRPILESEIHKKDAKTFSEESAKKYLHQLLGNGPRVAGTKYHLEKTVDLKSMLDSIAAEANLPVRTDWQFVSCDFWIEFSTPHASSYQNLSNLVAVLEGGSGFDPDGRTGSALLVNCHYDSVPFAIGASDNGVFCAVMLETLSKLSRRRKKLRHNIVFLFNGAEENPLQGSHGFLKHRWATGITSVVNLDAAGMNGKPAVFQVSDSRSLAAYRLVAQRPNAQSFGEALFKSGLIPSDTDFRIWRDFGSIHGVDVAFAKWGCVYHTRNDRPELIREGVVQNAGDVLLAMLERLADDELMAAKTAAASLVYFDYLNVFLVTYDNGTAQLVDISVALSALLTVAYYLSVVGFRRTSAVGLLWGVGGRLLCTVFGLVSGALAVLLMTIVAEQLRYLSRPWLVVPFYWIPYLVGYLLISFRIDQPEGQGGLNRSLRTLEAMAATRLLLAAVLLPLAVVPSLASMRYVITVPLAATSAASLVSITALKVFRVTAVQQLAMEFLLSLPGFLFVASVSLRLDSILVPTAGRMPINHPDLVVGGANLALAALAATLVSGVELLFSRKGAWLPLGLVGATSLALMLAPLSVYDDLATQRHYWFHSEIVSYSWNGSEVGRESGLVIPRQDAHTLARARPLFSGRWKPVSEECGRFVHCNLPLSRPRFGHHLNDSLFLHTAPPARFEPEPSLDVTRSCRGEECTLHCTMIGPAHSLLTLLPTGAAALAGWSLAGPPKPSGRFLGRPLFIVLHSVATHSTDPGPFSFNLTFRVAPSQQNQPLVEISHHAHKIAHPEDFTESYKRLLAKAPKYFNIASTLSVRTNYVF
ncbi:unnamed protein product, partial [Iphiclides podalirius]